MPNYSYRCGLCEEEETLYVSYEHRDTVIPCECGGRKVYQFPMQAVLGFQPFESYYDEALDCDVSGPRERKQIMAAMGVQEAGDASHGGRNWDNDNPTAVKEQRQIGRRLSDIQREHDHRLETRDDFVVQPVDDEGKVLDTLKWSELESA